MPAPRRAIAMSPGKNAHDLPVFDLDQRSGRDKGKLVSLVGSRALVGCAALWLLACGGPEGARDGVGSAGGASARGGASGTPGDGSAPSGPGVLAAPHALAVTAMGACVLTPDGQIVCWGYGARTWDLPSGTFSALYASGDEVACAVRTDGSASCFSDPDYGEHLSFTVSRKVTTLAVGYGARCGIDQTGEAFCDSEMYLTQTPPAGADFVAVSAGSQFGCGIRRSDRSIECWPGEKFGTCGYSPPAGQLDAPAGAFTALASGVFSSCAIATDGTLHCWGLGKATEDPEQISCFTFWSNGQSEPPAGTFRSVSVGTGHACAVRDDGRLACWGAGSADLCDGGVNCRQSRPPAGSFEQVGVGHYHSCGVTTAHRVVCWGFDQAGLLDPPAAVR